MRTPSEIRPLTGLRGVAALYVLLFHYFPFAGDAGVRSPLDRFVDHGYLAVDLFFVLSGFVMAMNYGRAFEGGLSGAQYRRFLGRRIARIYPLYIAATAAGFGLVCAGWLSYERTLPLGVALALNVIMAQAWGFAASFDSPAWSISAEWAAYLVFPILVTVALFRRAAGAWGAALVSALVLVVLCALREPIVHDYNLRAPLNLNGFWLALPVVRCIPEFTLGILAFRVAGTPAGHRIAQQRWIAPAVTLLAIGLLLLPKTDLAVVLVFPLLVVSLSSEAHLPGRLLAWAPAHWSGKLSYAIYLTHKLAYGLLGWAYARAHAAGLPHAQTLAALACIALTFPVAYVAYRTIELPGRAALRAFFERGARANRTAQARISPAIDRVTSSDGGAGRRLQFGCNQTNSQGDEELRERQHR